MYSTGTPVALVDLIFGPVGYYGDRGVSMIGCFGLLIVLFLLALMYMIYQGVATARIAAIKRQMQQGSYATVDTGAATNLQDPADSEAGDMEADDEEGTIGDDDEE